MRKQKQIIHVNNGKKLEYIPAAPLLQAMSRSPDCFRFMAA